MKIKVFIDFWNFQLGWNDYHRSIGNSGIVRIPWGKMLSETLVKKVADSGEYVGTHVYASINPKAPHDKPLRSFLNTMNTFPGYKVNVKERKPAKPIKCSNEGCRKEIGDCPHCKKPLVRTVEKGVDTMVAIELFQFGFENLYDKAILVSGDEDLAPAVDYIQMKGKYIVHAGWRNQSFSIRQACWDHFFLDDLMTELLPPPPTP